MVWIVLAFLGAAVWVLLYGVAAMTYLEHWLEAAPPLGEPQPNEDDPSFMAYVEGKVRHLED